MSEVLQRNFHRSASQPVREAAVVDELAFQVPISQLQPHQLLERRAGTRPPLSARGFGAVRPRYSYVVEPDQSCAWRTGTFGSVWGRSGGTVRSAPEKLLPGLLVCR